MPCSDFRGQTRETVDARSLLILGGSLGDSLGVPSGHLLLITRPCIFSLQIKHHKKLDEQRTQLRSSVEKIK